MIGQTLAHYRIAAALGAGGMGEVYRATDTKLGREVALKVLPAEMASSPERLARFQREAKALAALDHPNIVTIYSVEEAGGVHFLTMQLVEGQALDRLIPEGGLPVERIVEIAMAMAEALAAAHEKGIVHRDLKPANVMVATDGRVKVLDFGLAKEARAVDPADATFTSAAQTQAGVVMGTPAYMSPEQVAGRPVDHRTDIFSLGVLLYEMASGRRPFLGDSSAELASAILRDTPAAITDVRADVPGDLARIIRRCLEKDPRHRIQTARDVGNDLRDLARQRTEPAALATPLAPRTVAAPDSGASRADEGFWVAVLPFKCTGANADLTALAEGLSEEIVTGLSRFSYLRVISRSSTSRYAGQAIDVRTVGTEIGARYVMEGSLRQAGAQLRVAVQLVDATTGAHLWAETYERPFRAEELFALQDDLVPRIVSTVADWVGVLPRALSEAVQSKATDELSPYEAVLRGCGYYQRVRPDEHAAVRAALERAVESAPQYADAWVMLSMICGEEHRFGFNVKPDPLGRALHAARRAVDAAPSNHLSHLALAQAHYFRKELDAFRNAAERAVALNPMDGFTVEYLGHLVAFAGNWERGRELGDRARQLNPHHPAWYWVLPMLDVFRRGDYREARALIPKAVMPGQYYSLALFAAIYGQLGEREAAGEALREVLALRPDFAEIARDQFGKWYLPQLVEQLIDGLRKAGLDVPSAEGSRQEGTPLAGLDPGAGVASRSSEASRNAAVAIAVLPFADMSPARDQDYLCEGMAEEIMNALVRVDGIRVASRASAFRAQREGRDAPSIARALSVGHILDGSVRAAGTRLRVTAQLTDAGTGYQIWSERFDRELEDVFAVQDEIAAGVVEAVKARLAPGSHAAPARQPARNLEAYRCYLTGRHLRYAKEDHAGAIRAFEEAIRLDPAHAPSWTGLAESTALAAHFSVIPAREACAAARKALATAVELEGESADSLHGEAFVALIERRWEAMGHAWRRSIELQPTHVQALGSFGVTLCIRQKLDEGLGFLERAREADPLASFPYMLTALGLLTARRPQEAQRYAEQALTFEKEDASALFCSSLANVALGRYAEGIAAAEHGVAVSHRGADFLGLLGWALATAGRKDEARMLLEELRARPAAAPPIVSEGWLLGALGEIDAAFEVLARAEHAYQLWLYYTGLPGFDPLRADPRFAALLARLELPPAPATVVVTEPNADVAGVEKSIAVLPFTNMSPDADNEYFSDGLTEEIIADLSKVSALRVISRTSAMLFKGTAKDLPTIGRELGVRYVLEGSVRKAGSSLRITTQLVDAEQDATLWSEKFSGTVDDVFGIQEEIARKIVAALKVRLTDSEERRAVSRPIDNVVAYDCYLRARQEMYAWTPESLHRAALLVDQALGIVGENSLLLATRGQIEWSRANAMFDPDERRLDEAADYARRALTLAPDDPLGLFLRGIVSGLRGDTLGALRDTLRAHQQRPRDSNILTEMCRFANASGIDVTDYVSEMVRIDPLTPVTWSVVSFDHFVNGRIDEAVAPARRSLELASGVSMAHIFSAWALAQAGLVDEAASILETAGRALAGTLHGSWALFLRYALDGDAERASVQMTPLLERGASLNEHVSRMIADGYSLVGRHDEALKWLRIAMERGFINYPFLATYDPLLANVREDPRFETLMVEVKTRWERLAAAVPPPLRTVSPASGG